MRIFLYKKKKNMLRERPEIFFTGSELNLALKWNIENRIVLTIQLYTINTIKTLS